MYNCTTCELVRLPDHQQFKRKAIIMVSGPEFEWSYVIYRVKCSKLCKNWLGALNTVEESMHIS